MNDIKLTPEQEDSLIRLREKWDIVGEPKMLICGSGSITVECSPQDGSIKMLIGIETDGYTHS